MRIRLVALLAFMLLADTSLAAAGKIGFAAGEAFVAIPGEAQRLVTKGMDIDSGQTLVTRAGRLQVRLSDGALLALEPNSELRLDDYQFLGKADGSERGFFSLVKGGLRCITGLIGRSDHGAYLLRTAVATIGIRGTHYRARLCQGDCKSLQGKAESDGLYAAVAQGAIALTNAVGSLDVPKGRIGYAQNAATPPRMVDHMPAAVGLAREGKDAQQGREGAERVESSIEQLETAMRSLAGLAVNMENLSGLREEGDSFLAPAAAGYQAGQDVYKVDGRYVVANITGIEGGGASDVSRLSAMGTLIETDLNVSAYADANGALRIVANAAGSAGNGSAALNEVYNDGTLFMARWGGPGQPGGTLDLPLRGNQSIHWLLVKPYDSPLPTSGSASYNMVAATRVSSSDANMALGTLNSAMVSVNFAGAAPCGGLPCVHYDLNANIFRAVGDAGLDPADFETGIWGTQPGTVTGTACTGPNCSAYVHGIFGGSGAVPSHLGVVYEITDPAANRAFHGAAALIKP